MKTIYNVLYAVGTLNIELEEGKVKLYWSSMFLGIAATILAAPVSAATLSSCAPDFSSCNIYENELVTLPGLGIAGDVILLDPGTIHVSDVFRIFNNVIDTGGGTGLGDLAFLFSDDEGNIPSTVSVNAVRITEGPGGPNGLSETDYNGNGTIYRLFSEVPEPSSGGLIAIGLLGGAALRRRPAASRG